VTVFDDLQKDHAAAAVQWLHTEVVEDNQVGPFDLANLPAVGTIRFQHLQPGEELLRVKIKGAVAQQAGLMSQSGGEVAFADAGRSGDQQVLPLLYEAAFRQPKELVLVQ